MPRRSVPHQLAQAIGRRIRQLRQEQGLTSEKLAYESEVGSKGFLSDIENGRVLASLDTLQKIADRLQVELLDLVNFSSVNLRHQVVEQTRFADGATLESVLRNLSAGRSGAGERQPSETSDRVDVKALAHTTLLTHFPSVEIAAGFEPRLAPESPRQERIRMPGRFDPVQCFAARASGNSMQGWRSTIRDSDFLVFRWSRLGLAALVGSVALISRRDRFGDVTLHLKRVAKVRGRLLLQSDNPRVAPSRVAEGDEALAVLVRTLAPEDLTPAFGSELRAKDIPRAFHLSKPPRAPWSRVEGHLFVLLTGVAGQRKSLPKLEGLQLRNAETAFVLRRDRPGQRYRYVGVARPRGGKLFWPSYASQSKR